MKNDKNKAHNKGVIVGVIIVALVVGAIWIQSFFSVEDSTAESRWFLNLTKSILDPIFGSLQIDGNGIRKIAHAIEFFILGTVLSILLINDRPINLKLLNRVNRTSSSTKIFSTRIFVIRAGICLVIVLLVACSDEFIQIFSGRGARMSDIILDCVAGAIAILIALIVRLIVARYSKH